MPKFPILPTQPDLKFTDSRHLPYIRLQNRPLFDMMATMPRDKLLPKPTLLDKALQIVALLAASLSAALVVLTWRYTDWLSRHPAHTQVPVESAPVDFSLIPSIASLILGTVAVSLLLVIFRRHPRPWSSPVFVTGLICLLPFGIAIAYLLGSFFGSIGSTE